MGSISVLTSPASYGLIKMKQVSDDAPLETLQLTCATTMEKVQPEAHGWSHFLRRRPWVYLVVGASAFTFGLYYFLTAAVIKNGLLPRATKDPFSFSVAYGEPVAIRISDTVRFQLYTEEGMADFAHALPSGGHLVWVRPEGNETADPEPHTVTLFHQLRCLDVIRQAYSKVPEEPSPRLLHHCMNYLRQTILCRPHLFLEPVTTADGLISDAGYDGVCLDWEAVYREAERNHEAYLDWKRTTALQ